jgi:hypothetical protein
MTQPVVLAAENQGNGTHRLTVGTSDYNQATLTVTDAGLVDPALPTLLGIIHDIDGAGRNIPRRSARAAKRAREE